MVSVKKAQAPLRFLGSAEFAEALDVSRTAISELLRAHDRRGGKDRQSFRFGGVIPARFPEPVARLRCGPIWTGEQVDDYLKERSLPSRARFDRYFAESS
jgi:hypothetical protein